MYLIINFTSSIITGLLIGKSCNDYALHINRNNNFLKMTFEKERIKTNIIFL